MSQGVHDSNRIADLEVLQDAGHVVRIVRIEGDDELLALVVFGHDAGSDKVLGVDDLPQKTPVLPVVPCAIGVAWVCVLVVAVVPLVLVGALVERREEVAVLEGLGLCASGHDFRTLFQSEDGRQMRW